MTMQVAQESLGDDGIDLFFHCGFGQKTECTLKSHTTTHQEEWILLQVNSEQTKKFYTF